MSADYRTARDVAGLLAETLGQERALELVQSRVREMELNEGKLSNKECLEVLENLASEPGIVGITCRFAKSRLYLAGAGTRG